MRSGRPRKVARANLSVALVASYARHGQVAGASYPKIYAVREFRLRSYRGGPRWRTCDPLQSNTSRGMRATRKPASSFATHRRSRCGLVRDRPVLSSHFSPGAAPQAGQRTASNCFGLSSFVTGKPLSTKRWSLDQFPMWTVYGFVTTDMGRVCRKPLISALFICKPPL